MPSDGEGGVELDTKQRDAAGTSTQASLRSAGGGAAAALSAGRGGGAFYGGGPTGLAGSLTLRRGAPDCARAGSGATSRTRLVNYFVLVSSSRGGTRRID